MKSIPRYGLIIGLLFLSGCAKQPEYNTRTALSTEVATRWGSDVHSTVKGVSAERVDSHPDEIVLIIPVNIKPGLTSAIAFVIAIWNMRYAMLILTLSLLLAAIIIPRENGNTPLRPALVLSINYMSVIIATAWIMKLSPRWMVSMS